VIDVLIADSQDQDWFNHLIIQPTDSQKAGIWISILVNGGGNANVPLDTVSFIEPIEDFTHSGDTEEVKKLLSL